MITVRGSKMPLALACPPSLGGQYVVSNDSAIMRTGSAVHAWMQKAIPSYHDAVRDFPILAAHWRVSEKDLKALAYACYSMWKKEEKYFPSPVIEKYFEMVFKGIRYTGHIDLHAIIDDGDTLVIGDYKTGFLDDNVTDQFMTYNALGVDAYPTVKRVHNVIFKVRDRKRHHRTYTVEQVKAWQEGASTRLMESTFSADVHCLRCSRQNNCIAYREYAKTALTLLKQEMTTSKPSALYDAIKLVSNLSKQGRAWLKSYVMDSKEPIEYDENRNIVVIDEPRQVISLQAGYSVLAKFLTPEEILSCTKINKGDLMDLVREKIGTGQKSATVSHVLEELELANAISHESTMKLVLRRKDSFEVEE